MTQNGPAVELSGADLQRLDPRVAIPRYDRGALARSIVHIGVGGFHRAHQAVYLDDLCGRRQTDWSITGAGVLPADAAMAAALRPQDHLYTLVTRDRHGTNVRVIGSLVDYVLATPGLDPLVARLAAPETRIVSLTITEGGYPVDEATGDFLAPPADALPAAFEALARGFQARRTAGLGGFTVLSCDNIMGNGETARTATLGVVRHARAGPRGLGGQERLLPQRHGRPHHAPDLGGRPRVPGPRVRSARPLAGGGRDVHPVGHRGRLRLRAPALRGRRRPAHPRRAPVRDAQAAHPQRGPLDDPPTWPPSSATSTSTRSWPIRCWRGSCSASTTTRRRPRCRRCRASTSRTTSAWSRERFANPEVRDQVARVCLDGTSKFPKFLIPTIESQLDKGGPVRLSALALAGWCQYLLGRDEQGRDIALSADPRLEQARSYRRGLALADPAAFLDFARSSAHAPPGRPGLPGGLRRRARVHPRGGRPRHPGALAGRVGLSLTAPSGRGPQIGARRATAARPGPLFQLERREQIMQRLRARGPRRRRPSWRRRSTSPSETIRRDLTDLERERLVRRVHGGAIPWRGRLARAPPRGARGRATSTRSAASPPPRLARCPRAARSSSTRAARPCTWRTCSIASVT